MDQSLHKTEKDARHDSKAAPYNAEKTKGHLNPKNYQNDINKEIIIGRIKQRDVLRLKVLPLKFIANDHLEVAFVDPQNLDGEDYIRRIYPSRNGKQLQITKRIVPEADINRAIDYLFSNIDFGKPDEAEIEGAKDDENDAFKVEQQAEILHDRPTDKPIIKLLRKCLRYAIESRISDLHLEPHDGECYIKMRLDGVMNKYDTGASIPPEHYKQLIQWLKIQARQKIEVNRLPQDGSFYIQTKNSRVDVRFSSIPTIYGEKVVLRLLDIGMMNTEDVRVEKLVWDRDVQDKYLKSLISPHGLVVVTGPTGSGKTTTLQASIKYLQQHYQDLKQDKNIVTVEDPVEYRLAGVNQVSVNEEIGLSFAACLRSILRQDPNIIMIGEMRDFETADIGVRAALTGHLVLTTLHTNDAVSAVARLTNLKIRSDILRDTLRLLQAQRLVRKLCPRCGHQKKMSSEDVIARLKVKSCSRWSERLLASAVYMPNPAGCDACENVGFIGRKAIMEVIPVFSEQLKSIIEQNLSMDTLRKQAVEEGYRPMIEYAFDLAMAGEVSLDDVLALSIEGEVDTDSISNGMPEMQMSKKPGEAEIPDFRAAVAAEGFAPLLRRTSPADSKRRTVVD